MRRFLRKVRKNNSKQWRDGEEAARRVHFECKKYSKTGDKLQPNFRGKTAHDDDDDKTMKKSGETITKHDKTMHQIS